MNGELRVLQNAEVRSGTASGALAAVAISGDVISEAGSLIEPSSLVLRGPSGTGASADVRRDFEDLPRTYIIFFAFDSAALDDVAQGVLAQAAQDSLQYQPMMIEIAGFSGEGPEARMSAELADQRFSTVEEALIAEGLDSSLIARSELMADPDLPDLAVHRIEIHLELP